VARNELLEAQHIASLDRFKASGLIRRVRAADGDYDAECSARNGRIYPIGQAPARAHVNCSLQLIPLVEGAA
jgi:hypothetical protein